MLTKHFIVQAKQKTMNRLKSEMQIKNKSKNCDDCSTWLSLEAITIVLNMIFNMMPLNSSVCKNVELNCITNLNEFYGLAWTFRMSYIVHETH